MPKRETHLICGMLNTKDVRGYMRPLAPTPRSCGPCRSPAKRTPFPAEATRDAARDAGFGPKPPDRWPRPVAIAAQTPQARVLICGSLYLAGQVLRENG